LLFVQATAEGARLLQTRETEMRRLDALRSAKEEELNLAQSLGQTDAVKRLSGELDKLNAEFSAKSDLLAMAAGQLQGTMTDVLSNLFAGDPEAAKEPFKRLFGVLAGALSKQASALVTKLVLDDLLKVPVGGVASLLLVPVITAAVNTGIQALLQPVLNSLTSFASGGRIDEPTLALVGDGARLGESNREWIFRDTQLQTVVQQAATQGNTDVVAKLDEVIGALGAFSGRIHVRERDIHAGYNREDNRMNRRAR
jgi:hypothetical protein